jgi:hypothetical protein
MKRTTIRTLHDGVDEPVDAAELARCVSEVAGAREVQRPRGVGRGVVRSTVAPSCAVDFGYSRPASLVANHGEDNRGTLTAAAGRNFGEALRGVYEERPPTEPGTAGRCSQKARCAGDQT